MAYAEQANPKNDGGKWEKRHFWTKSSYGVRIFKSFKLSKEQGRCFLRNFFSFPIDFEFSDDLKKISKKVIRFFLFAFANIWNF